MYASLGLEIETDLDNEARKELPADVWTTALDGSGPAVEVDEAASLVADGEGDPEEEEPPVVGDDPANGVSLADASTSSAAIDVC